MTEQELRTSITPCIMAGNTWFVFDEIKSYADARVAQECKVLDEVVTLLHQTIASRNTEIAELKASLSQAQQMYTDLLVGTTDAIAAKDAEIKRLRDGIQKVADHLWVREPRNMSWLELRGQVSILHGLLSPAPITEDEDYDPEFCPQCNSMEWYNGDGECEYGCHHCGHVWIHGTPLNEDQE